MRTAPVRKEEVVVKRKKGNIKSGIGGTTSVKKHINWPHEVLYAADGQPTAYMDLSVVAFVRGYVLVMTSEQ